MTFPTTNVLDTFTRADGGLGANWGTLNNYAQMVIRSNAVSVAPSPAFMYYKTEYGINQECYVTVLNAAQTVRLLLRVADPTTTPTGYYAEFTGTDWAIKTLAGASVSSGTFAGYAAGDKLGFSADDTTLAVYFYDADGAATWTEIDSETDATYNRAGYIGLGYDNGGTAETLGVVDATPNVASTTGTVTQEVTSAVFVNGAVEFDIDAAAESPDNPFGTILTVGNFPADYITKALDAGTQYIQTVEVIGGTIVTTAGDFSRVGFLGHPSQKPELTIDDIYFTPSFFGSTSEQYWDFFIRADTPRNIGETTTGSIAGTWRVQGWELATLSGLTALFDDFGGGYIPAALTSAAISGATCAQNNQSTVTLTGSYLPGVGVGTPTWAWSPTPTSGQGTNTAVYGSGTLGINLITLTVTNPINSVNTMHTVSVWGSAVLDIIDALAAKVVSYTSVAGDTITPQVLGPENLPKSVDTYLLPVRLLMPADEALDSASFGFVAMGTTTKVSWNIVDMFLLKPVDSDVGLHGGVGRDLINYAKTYTEMLVGFRSPTGQSYVSGDTTTVQTGVFRYPLLGQRYFYGVRCTLSISEIISACS